MTQTHTTIIKPFTRAYTSLKSFRGKALNYYYSQYQYGNMNIGALLSIGIQE